MDIPDRITSAAEAVLAIADYGQWRKALPPPGGPFQAAWFAGWYGPPAVPQALPDDPVTKWLTSGNPGPGPVIYARTAGGEPGPVASKPFDPSRRGTYLVRVPGGRFGFEPSEHGLLLDLFVLADDVARVRAVASRCAVLAEREHQAGRDRHGDQLAAEAEDLTAFAADLEGHVPEVADLWLAEWRRLDAEHGPVITSNTRARPPARSARLR